MVGKKTFSTTQTMKVTITDPCATTTITATLTPLTATYAIGANSASTDISTWTPTPSYCTITFVTTIPEAITGLVTFDFTSDPYTVTYVSTDYSIPAAAYACKVEAKNRQSVLITGKDRTFTITTTNPCEVPTTTTKSTLAD